MVLTISHPRNTGLAAEALFVSDMQPSDCPTQRAIELTVTAMLLCHGSDGCAAELAAAFGDHPEALCHATDVLGPQRADLYRHVVSAQAHRACQLI